VLDDERLSDGAKLTYGKIARLAFKTGECWASNSFLDGTKTGRNSSRFIAELKNAGYIVIENEGSKYRKIKICPIKSVVNTSTSPNSAGSNLQPCQILDDNLANSGEVENESTSPNSARLISRPRQSRRGNLANSGGVHLANSGDRTSLDSTNLNLTASSRSPETLPGEAAVAVSLSPQELKKAVSAVDPCLIFTADFYPKAAAFIAVNGLGPSFLSWMYEQCKKQNPRSIRGLYYTLFFSDELLEIYKSHNTPPSPSPGPPDINCPVCGALHAQSDDVCHSCGLPEKASEDRIRLFRLLHMLPLEKRAEYFRREEEINQQCGLRESDKFNSLIANLNKEFGLETA